MSKYILIYIVFFGMTSHPIMGQFDISQIDERASDDLILFSRSFGNKTYLINKCGEIINEWSHDDRAGLSSRLLNNGNLIRAERTIETCCLQTSAGGLIKIQDWDNAVVWEFNAAVGNETQHHDFTVMPNGNILYLGWEEIGKEKMDSLGSNSSGALLWLEFVREIKPIFPDTFETIWEWKIENHVIQNLFPDKINHRETISEHPGKVDINYIGPASFSRLHHWHINAIDYNPERDEIILNARNNSEIWIIDHSTTTEEAASDSGGKSNKGGQILFRWGNPEAYEIGTRDSLKLYGSHGIDWLDDTEMKGYILFFNNGDVRAEGSYSTIEAIKPSYDSMGNYSVRNDSLYALDDHKIIYGEEENQNLWSRYLSNAVKLENGYLINEGSPGRIFEIDNTKDIVWQVQMTGSSIGVFKVFSYPLDFEGFDNRNLTPINSENIVSDFELCEFTSSNSDLRLQEVSVYPNPATNQLNIHLERVSKITLINSDSQTVLNKTYELGNKTIDISRFPKGIYFLQIANGNQFQFLKVVFQ